MSAPELADEPDAKSPDDESELADEPDAVDGDSGEDEAANPEPESDPNVAEVELTDDDLGDGPSSDLFTGTDDAKGDSSDDGESDDSSDDGDDAAELDALGERGESMEQAINEGAARLGVIGIDGEDEKDDLETEFTEIFEAFRLGYFGSRFAEEYIFVSDDEEVDPAWGLLGAALTCAAVVVWLRPDGDEIADRAKEAVENIAGGSL